MIPMQNPQQEGKIGFVYRKQESLPIDLSTPTFLPISINFGDGRRKKLQYFRCASPETPIQSNSVLHAISVKFENKNECNINQDYSSPTFSFRRLWVYAGPGWLMSIAYIDPGNLESDLQAGAIAGYQLIWVLFWATILGWLLQTLSLRLSVVTGRHLAQICRYEYNRPMALMLWIFTELAIIGSDIQEVLGSAIAFQVLFGFPLWIGCLITVIDTFTFLLLNALGMRALEAFFCTLITIMAVCFFIQMGIGQPDMIELLKGWALPLCDSSAVKPAVGMIGAVIMPHNLFLHSALVQTRKIHRGNRAAVVEANYYFTIEGGLSLLVSFFINLSIIAVFAKGFHNNPDYGTSDIGLKNADTNLEERFGVVAKYVWAIGLLAAGQASTMTGTFAGQFAMSGFLDLQWKPWKRQLLTRSIALGPSLAVAILADQELDNLNEWLNVQQSIQLPFALLPLLFFNCSSRIMGEFALSVKWKIFFSLSAVMVITINVFLTVEFMSGLNMDSIMKYCILAAFLILYLGIIGWLIVDFVSQIFQQSGKQANKEDQFIVM